jgi:hypothetical protein
VAPYVDPPPRRALLLPVLIAAVFLAVIGLSVGLVMGSRAQRQETPQGRQSSPVVVVPTSAAVPEPGPSRQRCRPESQTAAQRFEARGVLVVVLQVRTDSSTVWICADDVNRLFYHANRGGEKAEWVEGKTALFLPDVIRTGEGYRVTATDAQGRITVFDVTRRALSITHADGKPEVQRVREVVAG